MKDTLTDSNKSQAAVCPLSKHQSSLPLKYSKQHSSQIALNLLDKVIRNVLGQNLNLLTEFLNGLIARLVMGMHSACLLLFFEGGGEVERGKRARNGGYCAGGAAIPKGRLWGLAIGSRDADVCWVLGSVAWAQSI